MTKSRQNVIASAVLFMGAALLLSACGGGGGGGGGGGPAAAPPPAGGGTTGWVAGVFQAASGFKNRCAAARSGVDLEGKAFPDVAGSALEEKNWLRSWTRETYLWNTEVADTDPALGGTRTEYFATLRTTAKTASGKDKDDFHFSESTEAFLRSRNSAPTAGYGARLVSFSSSVPRDFRIQYTDPNTPASELDGGQAKFKRGARILSVNGIDLVNGGSSQAEIDSLNRGLFPPLPNVATTFVVRDAGATVNRTVTLTSANLSAKPVNRTQVLTTASGKVGYILFNTFSPFSSEREIVDAMESMRAQSVSDLVLDLRYNGGGLLAVASQLSYMVAGDTRTSNRTFERLRFNAAAGNNNPATGQTNSPVPFYRTGLGFTVTNGAALPSLNLPRVFVLTTSRTCSASEAVVNGLRGVGVEVIQIGGTTCGKPYGFYPTDNCGETYYTIQFQGVNDAGFGDYADGFIPANSAATSGVRVPGCVAGDDYNRELGDAQEGLLATALSYRTTAMCPIPPLSTSVAARSAAQIDKVPSIALEAPDDRIMDVNRDMTLPN